MKLGDNTPETCKHDIVITTLQDINTLETQWSYKTTVNLENLKFLKNYIQRF